MADFQALSIKPTKTRTQCITLPVSVLLRIGLSKHVWLGVLGLVVLQWIWFHTFYLVHSRSLYWIDFFANTPSRIVISASATNDNIQRHYHDKHLRLPNKAGSKALAGSYSSKNKNKESLHGGPPATSKNLLEDPATSKNLMEDPATSKKLMEDPATTNLHQVNNTANSFPAAIDAFTTNATDTTTKSFRSKTTPPTKNATDILNPDTPIGDTSQVDKVESGYSVDAPNETVVVAGETTNNATKLTNTEPLSSPPPNQTRPSPPPAAGGIIIFIHIPKTGGTTIRNHFGNATLFPQVVLHGARDSGYAKVGRNMIHRRLLEEGYNASFPTLMFEWHGRNSDTLVELAPDLRRWRVLASQAGIPFYVFSLLRQPMEVALSSFHYFRVGADPRYGKPLNATLDNFRRTLQYNPQCLYLLKSERAYFREEKFYKVTAQDCHDVQRLLEEVCDWIGDTQTMSEDTMPLLSYLITGSVDKGRNAGRHNVLSEMIRQGQQQSPDQNQTIPPIAAQKPITLQDLDANTLKLVQSTIEYDQKMYDTAVQHDLMQRFLPTQAMDDSMKTSRR